MAKEKTKQTKEVEEEFEQEVIIYKSKNELSRVLIYIFGVAAFSSSILFMMEYDPFTEPFPPSIYLSGFFIILIILFAIVSHLSIKDINIPYEGSCKNCLYCYDQNILNPDDHNLSKKYFCTRFEGDGGDVPLVAFVPCNSYELDKKLLVDKYLEDKNKKNDGGLK